jgi:hypothetical protein
VRPDGLRSRTGSQSTPSGSPILSRTGRGAGSSDGAARLPVAERECRSCRERGSIEHTGSTCGVIRERTNSGPV